VYVDYMKLILSSFIITFYLGLLYLYLLCSNEVFWDLLFDVFLGKLVLLVEISLLSVLWPLHISTRA
jgi:hypothetical protein